MKRFLMFISLVLFAGSFLTGSHLSDSDIKFYNAGERTFAIYVDSRNVNSVHVVIRDENRSTVYEEKNSAGEVFNKKYNLKNLPKGKYTVTVDNGLSISSQPIFLLDKTLIIEQRDETTFFKPSIRRNHDKIDVDLLSLDGHEINLQIVDYEGRINYQDELLIDGRFQRRFDISKLEKGNYSIYITVFDGSVSHSFEKTIRV